MTSSLTSSVCITLLYGLLFIKALQDMYLRRGFVESDNDIVRERIERFTLTIRPSVLSIYCDKELYFKTIQMNIGCIPVTDMRLIAEAVPVKKLNVTKWDERFTKKPEDMTDDFYYDADKSMLMIAKDFVSKSQYEEFGCASDKNKICKIAVPPGRKIEERIYGLSFRDTLIPKFEQFLTEHVRRVTGNVIMYDILNSFNEDDGPDSFIQTNTTEYQAGCIYDDGGWYHDLAENENNWSGSPSEVRNTKTPQLSAKADIYRYYKNCFSNIPITRGRDLHDNRLMPLPIQELQQRKFYIFNKTNKNALVLKKRKNYIYIFRAVVINTEDNGFTYCKKLDTFFVLKTINVLQIQRQISFQTLLIFLLIILFILLFLLICYCRFASKYVWTVPVEPVRKIVGREAEDMFIHELRKKYDYPEEHFASLAKRMSDLEKIHSGARDYRESRIKERKGLLGKRSKSETRVNEIKKKELNSIQEEGSQDKVKSRTERKQKDAVQTQIEKNPCMCRKKKVKELSNIRAKKF